LDDEQESNLGFDAHYLWSYLLRKQVEKAKVSAEAPSAVSTDNKEPFVLAILMEKHTA
jgi:hypothetical protein